MSTYGPLAVLLYTGVKKSNLFRITNASFFLEELIEFYLDNALKLSEYESATWKLHSLVSLFPSTEYFTKLLPTHSKPLFKEMVIFKLLLDVMTWYYKVTERPLYKKLQREVIPLALNFYKSITRSTLKEININLISNGCSDGKVLVRV